MDRQDEAEALFEKALSLAPKARAAFLNTLKAKDEALYTEIVSLLDAHKDAPLFFERLSDKFVAPLFADTSPPTPQRAGPYRIVRELGQGGMSTVYLARRDDGHFEQDVALKLVRSGIDEALLIHRFRSERQILASLNHPNIARLFDGGVTDSGRPYLIMEYVDGQSIDRYCDARFLSLDDRLRLFQTVVETVQYAHTNLVVHRDLKPSNILVTNKGQVKLLDFGIAKLLDADAPATAVTQTGLRLMTPEYAAPEQIKGDRITTATDVYQLGVMLYHLLTGHRPYRLANTSTYEIERAVCEKEPTRPSTVVAQVEEITQGEATLRITPEAVTQMRATELHVLQRTLSGDLDAILLKALRKEPEHRYATAEAFASDIQRYLAGHPVKARRGTWSYRARKFVRRNAWGVATLLLILALITGYAVTFLIQAQQVAQQRDRAQTEADKAEEVTEFLIDLFALADPEATNIEEITARQLLDQGARQVRAFGTQPQTQAQLLVAIGRVYEKLGLYDESEQLLDSSLTLRRQLFPSPHPELAEGRYHLAQTLFLAGDYARAESLVHEALATWTLLPESQAQQAEGLILLATLLEEKGDYAAADSLNHKALHLQRGVFGKEHPAIADALSNLAGLRRDQGDHAGADSLYRQALAMQRTLLGETHLDVAATLNNMAALRMLQGSYPAADSLYEQSLGILRQNLGNAHPDLARVLNNLGVLRQRMGRLTAAEPLLQRALAIRKQFLDPEHAGMAVAYYNLASVYQDQGNYAAAESLYHQALAIDRTVYGDESADVAIDLTKLASLFHDKGDLNKAAETYAQALEIGRQTLPPEHPRLGNILVGYGRVHVDLGQAAEAEDLLREAVTLRTNQDDPLETAIAQAALGQCLAALNQFEEAEALLVTSHDTFNANNGPIASHLVQVREALIALYEAWGKPDKAAEYRALSE